MEKYGIGNLLEKYKLPPKKVVKKKGGIQDPLTEQRVLTADFLNIELGQVLGVTKGWTREQLYALRQECMLFKANPQALWWVKWKKLNPIYGKQTKTQARKTKNSNKQNTLF